MESSKDSLDEKSSKIIVKKIRSSNTLKKKIKKKNSTLKVNSIMSLNTTIQRVFLSYYLY